MNGEPCPNCGRKGMYEGKLFSPTATHRCDSCDMEFEKVIRKGEIVWKGKIPKFTKAHKEVTE